MVMIPAETILMAEREARDRAAAARKAAVAPPFSFTTSGLRARGVGRVADEPRALLVLLTDIPGDDDIRALHHWLVHRPAAADAEMSKVCGECHLQPGETCDICGRKHD